MLQSQLNAKVQEIHFCDAYRADVQLRTVTCCILLEVVEEMKVRKDKTSSSHKQNIIV